MDTERDDRFPDAATTLEALTALDATPLVAEPLVAEEPPPLVYADAG